MPVYEYECTSCGHIFESVRPIGPQGRSVNMPSVRLTRQAQVLGVWVQGWCIRPHLQGRRAGEPIQAYNPETRNSQQPLRRAFGNYWQGQALAARHSMQVQFDRRNSYV